jgi:UDP-N-acetylmuramoyl-L-alanyl-D-glutamate--2,6-diaminopimelate ligase
MNNCLNLAITLPTHFSVTAHTNHVGPGSTFVVIKGIKEDGLVYVPQALAQGATTIVVEETTFIPQELVEQIQQSATLVRVPHIRQALAQLAAQACDFPAQKLTIVGVTGTKGKTTTTFILEHLLRTVGYKTALLSTVLNTINGKDFPTKLTTQQPDYLHMFLKVCIEAGVTHVVMEVSAQALTLHRVQGILFDTVIFTNFDQEHAEFYTTMDNYFAAKCKIFEQVKSSGTVLINGDDAYGQKILARYPEYQTYTPSSTAGLSAGSGISFSLPLNNRSLLFSCPALIGSYNLYNAYAAVSCALTLGLEPNSIAHALATFERVPGRMERYSLPNQAVCIIDYAHNPSSFKALLPTLKTLTPQLIVVFGCGGERDAAKRPVMGAVAVEIADMVILTTDNPRSEDPVLITQEIVEGIPPYLHHKVIVEMDRHKAIEQAYSLSQPQTIIALLGKGPDEYQEVKGVKTYFSERQIVQALR